MDGGPVASAAVVEAERLDEAIHGLERARPHASARRPVFASQIAGFIVILGLIAMAGREWPGATFTTLYVILLAIFFAMIALRLLAAGAGLAPDRRPRPRWGAALPDYTILCPLYREGAIVAQLIAALERIDYPADRLDVKLILEADDDETRAALADIDLPAWIEIVVVPVAQPRTKPKALNYALTEARGAFVCVYDAEDVPHPGQLRAALDAFTAGGPDLACVQAPLAISNGRASWIAAQFAAEYAIQFREMLPLFARARLPFAIGGTSNHFRTAALRACGGWDPYNVTEDADIGYRLALDGWRLDVITPPTTEDAPTTLPALLKQRTRWIKGHIQTWLVLMRRPVTTARQLGLSGFVAMQLQLGGGVLAAFAHGPLIAGLIYCAATQHAIGLPGWLLVVSGYATAAYGALVGAAATQDLAMARAALTMPLYWPLATIAAVRAVIELAVAPHYWAKTDHAPRIATADVDGPDRFPVVARGVRRSVRVRVPSGQQAG